MKFVPTPLEGAYVIELDKREDERGFFARLFCEREFAEAGLETRFVQINNSLSRDRGTLRGMHYQLSADNRRMMYVPRGFAHGFLTLTEDVEAFYLVSAFYAPDRERGVRWNDPCFAINWPAEPLVISDKDRSQRDFDPAWHLEAPPPSPPPLAGEG
jgi:dTDP-4-dehydrorhamnose 3,5-epimerase